MTGTPRHRVFGDPVTDRVAPGLQPLEVAAHPDRAAGSRPPPSPFSLADVYRRHAPFVFRVARRLGVPDDATDDIVHEVFIILHRRLPDYDGRASMTSWLYQITRGVISNQRRGRAREDRRLRLVPPPPPSAPPHPEREVEVRQAADAVRTFVEQLDPDQRDVFELCDVDGLTAPEAARLLDAKLNTVYSRLRLARDKFRSFAAGYRAGRQEGER